MTDLGLFWIAWYLSWVIIEHTTKERIINMREQMKFLAIISTGLLLFIGFNCGGKKNNVKELSFTEQMDIKYAHVVAHNDSLSALFREMEDTSVDLDSILNNPIGHYVSDSSKIIAIKYPVDQFTDFEQAFAKGRYDLGPDKHFIWRNKIYSTNYKEEGYPPWTYQSRSSTDQQ